MTFHLMFVHITCILNFGKVAEWPLLRKELLTRMKSVLFAFVLFDYMVLGETIGKLITERILHEGLSI